MKWWRTFAGLAAVVVLGFTASAQLTRLDRAKGFKLPEYFPATNGMQKLKTLLTGSEAQLVSAGVFRLTDPRIEGYSEAGQLDWVAASLEATVNMASRNVTVTGTNQVIFRTASTNFFVTGRGFLWQQSNSVLILSNETRTWIDKAAMTNVPALR